MQYSAEWEYNGKTYRYSFTAEDIVTLGRAVQAEGAPMEGILRTLLQRFAVLHALGKYSSLTKFLQAYVQPINPRWFLSGDLHKARIAQLHKIGNDEGAASELAAARIRPIKAAKSWGALRPEVRELVVEALRGRASSFPLKAVHYWASRAPKGVSDEEARQLNAAKKPELDLLDVGTGWGAGVNVFFTAAEAKPLVRLLLKASSGPSVATLIVGVGLLYLLAKSWG